MQSKKRPHKTGVPGINFNNIRMSFPNHYILVNCVPVEEPDIFRWGEWFEKTENRIVAKTRIGIVRVSTLFLGLDHSWGKGPPLLFETIVLKCPFLGDLRSRYSTWADAENGHRVTVQKIEALTVFN